MAIGKKTGGRKKGSVNKTTKLLQGRVDAKIDAELTDIASDRVRQIITGTLVCQTCRGKLKTPYSLPVGAHGADCSFNKKYPIECAKLLVSDSKHRCAKCCSCEGIGMRTCESCYKSGFEQCSPELIGKLSLSVRREAVPELRAIEHRGQDGGPILISQIIRDRRYKRNAISA